MSYVELKKIVETLGIRTSALTLPTTSGTYAVIRMVTHQAERCADDLPVVFGEYMQIDLFADANIDIFARRIIYLATQAGYVYRGRSDSYENERQHAEIRLCKLEVAKDE